MEYLELDCRVAPGGDYTEILIAYLAAAGFTMFQETGYGVKAYIPAGLFNRHELDAIPILTDDHPANVEYKITKIPGKNWNEEWEKNFEPVVIGNDIYVRAEYHPADPSFKYELVIHPRMAFGTGHHATTSLVMEEMLEIPFSGKKVLDMGCGTGILAILASKSGAGSVLAIDNDLNAVENTAVNCDTNNVGNVTARLGDVSATGNEKFDMILANINRNIILDDLPGYSDHLSEGGLLVTSGFYLEDLELIVEKAVSCALTFKKHTVKDNWCCALFVKEI